jgi:hypothetical protein
MSLIASLIIDIEARTADFIEGLSTAQKSVQTFAAQAADMAHGALTTAIEQVANLAGGAIGLEGSLSSAIGVLANATIGTSAWTAATNAQAFALGVLEGIGLPFFAAIGIAVAAAAAAALALYEAFQWMTDDHGAAKQAEDVKAIAEELEKAHASNEKFIAGLKKMNDTFGMTAHQKQLFEIKTRFDADRAKVDQLDVGPNNVNLQKKIDEQARITRERNLAIDEANQYHGAVETAKKKAEEIRRVANQAHEYQANNLRMLQDMERDEQRQYKAGIDAKKHANNELAAIEDRIWIDGLRRDKQKAAEDARNAKQQERDAAKDAREADREARKKEEPVGALQFGTAAAFSAEHRSDSNSPIAEAKQANELSKEQLIQQRIIARALERKQSRVVQI